MSRDHLLKQGKRALGYHGPGKPERCVFHNPQGLKCAVGVFIPESHYMPGLEHEVLAEVGLKPHCRLREALLAGGVDTSLPGMQMLLKRLQGIHDRNLPDGEYSWAVQLKLLAVDLEHLLGRFEEYEDAYPPIGTEAC